jgi:hypothetical protein
VPHIARVKKIDLFLHDASGKFRNIWAVQLIIKEVLELVCPRIMTSVVLDETRQQLLGGGFFTVYLSADYWEHPSK